MPPSDNDPFQMGYGAETGALKILDPFQIAGTSRPDQDVIWPLEPDL